MGFEYLWGGDSTTSLGILLHCLITLMGTNILIFQLNSLYFSWCSPSCTSPGYNQEETVSEVLLLPGFTPTPTHSYTWKCSPLLSPLFSRLNTPSLLRLSSCEMLQYLKDLCCTFQEHPSLCCLGSLMEGSGCWGWLPWASHAAAHTWAGTATVQGTCWSPPCQLCCCIVAEITLQPDRRWMGWFFGLGG